MTFRIPLSALAFGALAVASAEAQVAPGAADTASVQSLVVLLASNDVRTASAAESALIARASNGGEVLPALVDALGKGQDLRVTRVILAIDSTGARAVPLLIPAVRATDPGLRLGAITVLRIYGPRAGAAAPAILEMILYQPVLAPSAEVNALSRIGVAQVEPVLRAAAIDSFLQRALRAGDAPLPNIRALGLFGRDATSALLSLASGGGSAYVMPAVVALAPMAASGADPRVTALYLSDLQHWNPDVRAQAALAIAGLGQAGIPVLDSVRKFGPSASRGPAEQAIAAIRQAIRSGLVEQCYDLATSPWESKGKTEPAWTDPRTIRFTLIWSDAPVRPPAWRVVAANDAREARLNGAWNFAPGDSSKITLSWYDGLTGSFLNFRVLGDSLVGNGERSADLPEVTPYTAKAWGKRVPCTIE